MSTTIGRILLALVVYIPVPAAAVAGWIRWARHRSGGLTVFSMLSLIGFSLATASVLLAAGSIVYAQAIHGFRYYDPRLLRIFRVGFWLSLSGIIFSFSGLWGRNPLRWFAPLCAAGMFVFWFWMAMLE